jgi:hypothetical protein
LRALGKAIVFKHGSKSAKLDGIRSIIDFTGGKKKEKERAVKSRLGFTSRQSTDLHPATEPEHGMPANTEKKSSLPEEPTSSIVLIDEIDKAPRDFPNDILNEIEEQVFTIKELGERVPPADTNAKILVIMTSNNEKNLPDAFLRRCIYHYIEFPDTRQLEEIVNAHFPHLAKKVEDHKGSGKEEPLPEKQVMGIINTFNELRSLPLLKKPATAEFIDWLHILEQENLLDEAQQPYPSLPENIKKQLEHSMGLLFKNNNDITQVREAMKKM